MSNWKHEIEFFDHHPPLSERSLVFLELCHPNGISAFVASGLFDILRAFLSE